MIRQVSPSQAEFNFSQEHKSAPLLTRSTARTALRYGLTLLEVILALSLTVVATGLIGGLIQIYQSQLEISKDNVRQTRLARAVLTMIADDIRGVLREYQNEDAKTLEQFLTASAASNAGKQGGGGSGAGATGGGQAPGPTQAGGTTGGAGGTSGALDAAASATDPLAMTDMTATSTVIPPGILGTDSVIEIDVSRPPRPDEYIGEMKSLLEARIVDVPSDTKKVSYFVQAPQLFGITDPLTQLAGSDPNKNTGLVRRSLDRAVTRWANDQGQSQQLMSTGQILAPEIVALSFSYFDGMQWMTYWDSSTQGLPWAVEITIAMQHARYARDNPIIPGLPLASLLAMPKAETGIETYSMLAIIPGVQLLKTPMEQTDLTSDGSTSPTSSLGF